MKRLPASIDFPPLLKAIGRVCRITGILIEVRNLKASLGDYCTIVAQTTARKIEAEVVGFREDILLLMPFGPTVGLSFGDVVHKNNRANVMLVSDQLFGKLLDAFGRQDPQARENSCHFGDEIALTPLPVAAFNKAPLEHGMHTGVPVIDSFNPIAVGQRMGIFAGSGVGKTTLFRRLLKQAVADVKIVVLVGERGREMIELRDFVDSSGLSNCIIVAATSDEPPLARIQAVHTGTALARHYCNMGKHVLFMVDSVTRFAMAQREVGLAIGEPPTTKGYPPSVFSMMPKLVEQAGNFCGKGAITGIYTILVEGDDMDDPIADQMRSVLDGHIVLSRAEADRGIYPPIDLAASRSRLINELLDASTMTAVRAISAANSTYQGVREMVSLGAYKSGDNPETDRAIALHAELTKYIAGENQNREFSEQKEKLQQLMTLATDGGHY